VPTFLHVGCGHFTKANTTKAFQSDIWRELRFDIDPAVNPDFEGSMTDMSAVESASVDAIYSAHNIEHLYPHDVPVALREFLRVLRPQGFVLIVCPDLQSVCELVAADGLEDPAYISAVGPITPADILYGHRPALAEGNLYMAHRYGFTLKTLKAALSEAGFASFAGMRNRPAFELWTLATVSTMDGAQLAELATKHFPAI
jgi:ubiquinone/menaquinone biosynthesis C-methylase UbiE